MPAAVGISEKLIKYSWAEQPNKRFTIFSVPIFRLFSEKKRGKVDASDAAAIVKNFEADRETGYYPRIHLDHQQIGSSENKPGVGYLDNLRFEEGAETIYADFVEIKPEIFSRIKAIDLPYRSVEYESKKKKILGLALLESQPSFFVFPILALREESQEITQFQAFSWGERAKKLYFQEGNMPETINTNPADGTPPGDNFCEHIKKPCKKMQNLPPTTQMQGEAEVPPPEAPSGDDKMDRLLALMEKLYAAVMEEEAEEEAEEVVEGEEEMTPPPEPEEPGSVAMQLIKQQGKVLQQMSVRLQNIEGHNSTQRFSEKLQELCNVNPGLNYQANLAMLEKFSSDADRETFLGGLEAQTQQFPLHAATEYARKMRVGARSDVMQKFSKETPEMQRKAQEAYQNYVDTLASANEAAAKSLKSAFPSVEQFCEHMVEMEKLAPGAIKRMTI